MAEESKQKPFSNVELSALASNVMAAVGMADVVRTTLGPRGLDKLLVDQLGNRVITNDGYTVLVSLKTNHPISRLIVEIAERQEMTVGDGTTSTVIIAAEMLKEGYRVISEYGIHPSKILSEIDEATDLVTKYLQTTSKPINSMDDQLLSKVLKTTTASKLDGEQLSKLILKSISLLSERQRTDLRHGLILLRRLGEDLFLDGIAIEHLPIETSFIKELGTPIVCLVKGGLKFPLEGTPIQDDNERHDKERQIVLNRLLQKGVNVILTNAPEIDQALKLNLITKKVLIIRVSTDELNLLSRALTSPVVYGLQILTDDPIPSFTAQSLELDEEKKLTIIKAPQSGVVATLIVGGATVETSKERARTCVDGISGAHFAMKGGVIVGGGVAELNAARYLEKHMMENNNPKVGYTVLIRGLESTARQVLDNAGFNGYDMLVKLKSKPDGIGVDIATGEFVELMQAGVIDPLLTRVNAIKIAAHIAKTILKIDKNLLKGDETREQRTNTS